MKKLSLLLCALFSVACSTTKFDRIPSNTTPDESVETEALTEVEEVADEKLEETVNALPLPAEIEVLSPAQIKAKQIAVAKIAIAKTIVDINKSNVMTAAQRDREYQSRVKEYQLITPEVTQEVEVNEEKYNEDGTKDVDFTIHFTHITGVRCHFRGKAFTKIMDRNSFQDIYPTNQRFYITYNYHLERDSCLDFQPDIAKSK